MLPPPTVLAFWGSRINLIMREKEEKVLNLNEAELGSEWKMSDYEANTKLFTSFKGLSRSHMNSYSTFRLLAGIGKDSLCFILPSCNYSTIQQFIFSWNLNWEFWILLLCATTPHWTQKEAKNIKKNHLNLFLFQRLRLGKHLKKFFHSSSLLSIPSLKLNLYLSSPGSRPLHLSVEWRSEQKNRNEKCECSRLN